MKFMPYPETDREKPKKPPSLNLNSVLIKVPDATFLFRVKGDSMTGVGIYPGDMLVVDKSIDPKHNDIVIAIYNNDFTFKLLYKMRRGISRRNNLVKSSSGDLLHGNN